MSNPLKFHRFDITTFHGLVYCDYCAKMLWGLARQGVQCSGCGYHCHEGCKDMALQCRPLRHSILDSSSMTDSEPESLSKYSLSSPRGSIDFGKPLQQLQQQQQQQPNDDALSMLSSGRSISHHNHHNLSKRYQHTYLDNNFTQPPQQQQQQQKDDALKSPSLAPLPSIKAYRKALKHQIQHSIHSAPPLVSSDLNSMTPQQLAKTFTRLTARSRAFFHLIQYFYDVYNWKSPAKSLVYVGLWILFCLYPTMVILLLPPVLILLLFFRSGVQTDRPANQILLPRYDEGSPEYYTNLVHMQSCLVFFIRWYDNLAYHLQHASLNENVYWLLFVLSLLLTGLLYVAGRCLVLTLGLVVLLNKTWFGGVVETAVQLTMEMLQTIVDLVQHLIFPWRPSSTKHPSLEVSMYENQRWWTGTGYTSQLLRSERTPWSNITGTEPLPSKENMPPPDQYHWADDDWQLDLTGPWSDGILGLVSIIECDDQGWVYTDHKWADPKSRPEAFSGGKDSNTRSLTRRRRWYRKAKLMDPTTATTATLTKKAA